MEMIAVIVNSVEHVGKFCFCMITFAGKTIFWQQEYGDSVWSVKDVLIHGTVFRCCFPSRFFTTRSHQNMELRQLQSFVRVAQLMSFSEDAS